MLYKINGLIKLSPLTKLRIDSTISFVSPSGAQIQLKSETDEVIRISILMEGDEDLSEEERARLELSRTCNLLSFLHNISISNSQITGVERETLNQNGEKVVVGKAHVDITARLSVLLSLGEEKLEELVDNLGKSYSTEFETTISIWRQAMSMESSTERFFSLYRLMEYLFQSVKNIDKWIKARDPSVQLIPPQNKYRTHEHTVYTYLRDSIAHYKEEKRLLPLKETRDNLPKFQSLVKQAIKEKFAI